MAKFFVLLALGVALASAQDYSGTNYNAGDSGRSETVAPDGSVRGQYSYTDPNGKLITIKYRAGKDGYHVEGDHLPKAPQAPQHPSGPQQNSAPQNAIPSLPQHTDPNVLNYNPFFNPNVPNQQSQPPAPAPAPTHNSGYNPFYNPHVPQNNPQPYTPPQAPSHPPAPQYNHHAPQYNHHAPQQPAAPELPKVPQHTDPAVVNYNPFYNKDTVGFNPFRNPNVPDHLYQNAPNGNNNQYQQQQYQPQQNSAPQQNYPGSFGPAGSFPGFSHPNSIPGAPQYNKGGRFF